MEESRPKTSTSDEIDLSQLFRWIGKGFSNFGQGILNSLADLRYTFFNNRLFFGITITVGLLLGLLYSEFLSKKFYKSSMILSCEYLTIKVVNSSIEKLNQLAKEKDRLGLASELNIDKEIAKNILEFKAAPFTSENDAIELEGIKEKLKNLSQNNEDFIKKTMKIIESENRKAYLIEVKVRNPEIIKNLEQSIANYFQSINYIRTRLKVNREILLERKSKLLRESQKLDSMKFAIFQNLASLSRPSNNGGGANNFIMSDQYSAEAVQLFATDLSIHSEIQEIDYKISTNNAFEVVDGLTSFKEPDSASLPEILVISFFASWVLGYLILGLFKFDRYLAKLSQEQA